MSSSWNVINLPSPIPIPPSDLWIGFEATSGPSGRHSWAGRDSGPNDPEGQYMYFDSAWYKLTALGSAFTYNWNIRAIIEVITNVKSEIPPAKFELYQNYPNPFNPSTTITYSLSHTAWTNLKVYNIIGQEVSILINKEVPAGIHSIKFDAVNLPGGIYFYKLLTKGNDGSTFSSVKKMILLK